MGMPCEAGSTEAIQGAELLRGSKYTKHHTTKAIEATLWSGPFAAKNLAFTLTTGRRTSAMLRIEGSGSLESQMI
jgi:hypothetical protein